MVLTSNDYSFFVFDVIDSHVAVLGFFGFYVFNMDFLFLPLFIVSFVLLVGFKLPVIDFSKFEDLSYGLYIFHFSLIQLFVNKDRLTGSIYIDFFIVISNLLMLSRFSCIFIERIAISYGKRNYL